MRSWYDDRCIKEVFRFPVRSVILLAFAILFINSILVVFIYHLNLSLIIKLILDSFLLLTFLGPVLYFLVFLPMYNFLSERERFEKALMENESNLNSFYQSGLMGVFYWGMEGIIAKANQKFLEITGYSIHDLDEKRIKWMNLTPPEYHDFDNEKLQELIVYPASKKPFERELIKKDGERIWVEIANALLDKENGVSFILDISERKQAENLMNYYSQDLERTVEHRTAELNEARQKAETAVRMKLGSFKKGSEINITPGAGSIILQSIV